jgi:cyclophilin family peptidyl-prolyl cis-trans isomerase
MIRMKLQHLLWLVIPIFMTSCAKPIAQFIVSGAGDKQDNVAPAKFKFENQSTEAESFVWFFGDGDSSTIEAPYHVYKESGKYEVTLIAKKGKKTNISTQTIEVKEPEDCLVELETEFGTMTILLYDDTPLHRDNFIKLVEEGFYEGLLFHRVMNGFMIQGGDPQSKNAPIKQQLGTGGPGYNVPAEFNDTLIHIKGALCAARQPDQVNPKKESSGSQFYIVQGRGYDDNMLNQTEAKGGYKYTSEQRTKYKELGGTAFLDREYTVFGQVIKGLEVIDKIAAVKTMPNNRPEQDVKMKMRIVK